MLKRQVLSFSEPVFLGVLNYLYLLSLIPYLLTENDNFLLDNREERRDKIARGIFLKILLAICAVM